MWENKVKYKTKYFGQLYVNEEDDEIIFEAEINYIKNNKSCKKYITIILANLYENKIKPYINILNKYSKLHTIGKKELIKRYKQKENMLLFIKDYHDKLSKDDKIKIFGSNDFENININKFIESIDPPHITIIKKDKKMVISLGYSIINGNEITMGIEFNNKLKVIDAKYYFGGNIK